MIALLVWIVVLGLVVLALLVAGCGDSVREREGDR